MLCSRTRVLISSAHQRRREGQAPHWGFQLVHRRGDTLGTVRHQWLDPDFELLLVLLIFLRVAGGKKVLSSGSWWTFVKDKVTSDGGLVTLVQNLKIAYSFKMKMRCSVSQSAVSQLLTVLHLLLMKLQTILLDQMFILFFKQKATDTCMSKDIDETVNMRSILVMIVCSIKAKMGLHKSGLTLHESAKFLSKHPNLNHVSRFWFKGPYYANVQVHICSLCLYCDIFPCLNVQKALYYFHTACAAAPLFTLCLKPEPSLLWLVSWPADCYKVMSLCYGSVGEKLPLEVTLGF